MFVKVAYDTLVDESRLLIDTLKRSVLSADSKNLVFKVSDDGVSLLALTDLVVAKTQLDSSSVEVSDFVSGGGEPSYFQVPALVLEKILSTYAASELNTPLSLTFHPVSDMQVAITVRENLKIPNKAEEERTSSVTVNVSPFYISDLHRLERIEIAETEGVEFTELTEEQRDDMISALQNMFPYIPSNNAPTSDLIFHPERHTIELPLKDQFFCMKSQLSFFMSEGGIRPAGLLVLKELLSKGLFSFYLDSDKSFCVMKQGSTIIGFLYDSDLNYQDNPVDSYGDLTWFSLSRPLVEMYYKRMTNLNISGDSAQVLIVVSEDKTVTTFHCGELELEAPIELIHYSEGSDEQKIELSGFHFSVPISYFASFLFGKGEYADDIRFAFAKHYHYILVKSFDSSDIWSVSMVAG